ncbi:gamma-glutamylcyclotransferase family protein [Mycolicibacterium fortuitum]|uniref:gamma-glutamylcyclotransferase family protein n=1 Tax=Mycolicibacterium fortuitum TaxID=1766 RepID=UPI001AF019FA|nr:gamma-glutamylcyclotransferase [Mycolicibacterium fortuitum]
MSNPVFVYGTLQPGQPRWPALAPFALRSGVSWSVSVAGRLFDTGYGWPAAVFDPVTSDQIPGVVVSVRPESTTDALAALDDVEGVATGLFLRVVVHIEGQPCWAYQWSHPTDRFRRIARWPHTNA